MASAKSFGFPFHVGSSLLDETGLKSMALAKMFSFCFTLRTKDVKLHVATSHYKSFDIKRPRSPLRERGLMAVPFTLFGNISRPRGSLV